MTSGGRVVGIEPPGVNTPISFGSKKAVAVDTTESPRPSFCAMPLRTVEPKSFSTCVCNSGAACGLPSHDMSSVPSPADLTRFRKPLKPPGEPTTKVKTSRTNAVALDPRPNLPATSEITVSKSAILFSHLKLRP